VPAFLRSGVIEEVAPGFAVERLGSHVEGVGPGDRAGLGIDLDAREVVGVTQGLEDAAPPTLAEPGSTVLGSVIGWRRPMGRLK
jgi:hypothetical protein